MRRGVVTKSPQAQLDVVDAALYIAEDNPLAGDRVIDALNAIFHALGDSANAQ